MANHHSALKRAVQTRKRTVVNRRNRGLLRASLRSFRESLAGGQREPAEKQLLLTVSRVDKAVGKGVLHKNTAGRLKSRLQKRLNKTAAA